MKLKQIPLDSIFIDQSIYPRDSDDWQTVESYKKAMQTGDKFPPLVVASIGDRLYVLIDGRHRLKAIRSNKYPTALCNYVGKKTLDEAWLMSVELNSKHGRPLSFHEKLRAFERLESMKVSTKQIVKILHIPLADLKNYMVKRVAYGSTGKKIILKSALKHLAGQTISEESEEEMDQQVYSVGSQLLIIQQLTKLLENRHIDLTNPQVRDALVYLSKLVDKLLK